MAFKVPSVTLSSDITVIDSYARIQSIEGNKDGISVLMFYYKDQSSFVAGKTPFLQKNFDFVPSVADDAPNYHKQGYEHAKSLPEFAGAIDC